MGEAVHARLLKRLRVDEQRVVSYGQDLAGDQAGFKSNECDTGSLMAYMPPPCSTTGTLHTELLFKRSCKLWRLVIKEEPAKWYSDARGMPVQGAL